MSRNPVQCPPIPAETMLMHLGSHFSDLWYLISHWPSFPSSCLFFFHNQHTFSRVSVLFALNYSFFQIYPACFCPLWVKSNLPWGNPRLEILVASSGGRGSGCDPWLWAIPARETKRPEVTGEQWRKTSSTSLTRIQKGRESGVPGCRLWKKNQSMPSTSINYRGNSLGHCS